MPITVDGTYERPYQFVDEFATGDKIFRSDMDVTINDLAVGINAALARYGKAGQWDASSGLFPASDLLGDTFVCAVAGTVDDIDFAKGDIIVASKAGASTTIFPGNWTLSGKLTSVATIAKMISHTGLVAGDFVKVWYGYNLAPEEFVIVANGTYTANAQEVIDLIGSSLQAVSLRDWFKTVAELVADTRPATVFASNPAIAVDKTFKASKFRYDLALSGAIDNHLTTAGGAKLYVRSNSQDVYNLLAFNPTPSAADSAITAAIAALTAGDTLEINENYTVVGGFEIEGKTSVRITGRGKITLSGGASATILFQPKGTVTDLRIDTLTLIGDGNAAWNQNAIGNFSGAVVTDAVYEDLKISDFNVGISLNAESSGSYNRPRVRNNVLTDISGESSGQGYGIHVANATGHVIEHNTITRAGRHSIYQARGTDCNGLIQHNRIVEHRPSYTNQLRAAIACFRSTGVIIKGNTFIDCQCGQINASHSSADDSPCEEIQIIGNIFRNRQDDTPEITIGAEQAHATLVVVPENILIQGNRIYRDCDDAAGASIRLFHGLKLDVLENEFFLSGLVTNVRQQIFVGNETYADDETHLNHVCVCENKAYSAAGATTYDFVYIDTTACTNDIHLKVMDNHCPDWAAEWEFETTPTNALTKLKFMVSIATTPTSTLDGDTYFGAFTATGVKPTSKVSTDVPYSGAQDGVNYDCGAHPSNLNSVILKIVNASGGTLTPTARTQKFWIEDF